MSQQTPSRYLPLVWRILALVPLPFVLGLALLQADLLGVRVPAAPPDRGQAGVIGLLFGLSVVFAGFLWTPARALRVLGYAVYAVVLALDAGVATLLGVVAWQGGLAGEPPASTGVLIGLCAAFAATVLGIVVLMAAFVSDVRGVPAR